MADKRGYDLSNTHLTWDGDVYFNVDESGFARAKKYKASVLKEHFKVGDQTYTQQNYVSNGETLTVSIDQLDLALKTLSDTVGNLDFDQNGILAIKVNLSVGDVAALGATPKELIAAAGTNKAFQLIDIKWAIYPTTQLDVGTQDLIIYNESFSLYLAIIRSKHLDTANTLIKGVQIQGEYELGIDKKLYCKLSGGVNPTSGVATMSFFIIYKVISV